MAPSPTRPILAPWHLEATSGWMEVWRCTIAHCSTLGPWIGIQVRPSFLEVFARRSLPDCKEICRVRIVGWMCLENVGGPRESSVKRFPTSATRSSQCRRDHWPLERPALCGIPPHFHAQWLFARQAIKCVVPMARVVGAGLVLTPSPRIALKFLGIAVFQRMIGSTSAGDDQVWRPMVTVIALWNCFWDLERQKARFMHSFQWNVLNWALGRIPRFR